MPDGQGRPTTGERSGAHGRSVRDDCDTVREWPFCRFLADHDGSEARVQYAGVEFIAENGGGPGVRLRKSLAAKEFQEGKRPEELDASNDD